MKKISLLLISVAAFISCQSPELERQQAFELAHRHYGFPKIISLEMQQNDGERAAQLRLTTLVDQGLITIEPADAAIHIDSPLFKLTEKGRQYQVTPIVPGVVKVKLATENLANSGELQHDKSANTAALHFKTEYADLTPFHVLSSIDFKKGNTYTSTFTKNDKGEWTITK